MKPFQISRRKLIQPSQARENLSEPTYEYDEDSKPAKEAKWKQPHSDIELMILRAARPGRSAPTYPDHELRHKIVKISKSCVSLKSGLTSAYPLEWVEHCCEFCSKLWREGKPMSLENLVTYINNDSKKMDWIANWSRKNNVPIQIRDQEENE